MKSHVLLLLLIGLTVSKYYLINLQDDNQRPESNLPAIQGSDYQDNICMPGYPCATGTCAECECSDPEPDPEATCMPGYPCQDGKCNKCECAVCGSGDSIC